MTSSRATPLSNILQPQCTRAGHQLRQPILYIYFLGGGLCGEHLLIIEPICSTLGHFCTHFTVLFLYPSSSFAAKLRVCPSSIAIQLCQETIRVTVENSCPIILKSNGCGDRAHLHCFVFFMLQCPKICHNDKLLQALTIWKGPGGICD